MTNPRANPEPTSPTLTPTPAPRRTSTASATPTTPTGRTLFGVAITPISGLPGLKVIVIVKESESTTTTFEETLSAPPKVVIELIEHLYSCKVKPKHPKLRFNVTVEKKDHFGRSSATVISAEDSVHKIGSYELTFTNAELSPDVAADTFVVQMPSEDEADESIDKSVGDAAEAKSPEVEEQTIARMSAIAESPDEGEDERALDPALDTENTRNGRGEADEVQTSNLPQSNPIAQPVHQESRESENIPGFNEISAQDSTSNVNQNDWSHVSAFGEATMECKEGLDVEIENGDSSHEETHDEECSVDADDFIVLDCESSEKELSGEPCPESAGLQENTEAAVEIGPSIEELIEENINGIFNSDSETYQVADYEECAIREKTPQNDVDKAEIPDIPNYFICLSKCDPSSVSGRRVRKTVFRMPCPRKECPEEPRTWTCAVCYGTLFCDPKRALFCKCGLLQKQMMSFRCADSGHGPRYADDCESSVDKAIAGIEPCEEFNVVLLGETGAGKSTLINAIFNYLPFASLEDALRAEKMHIPIPTSFVAPGITERVHFGGTDENESQKEGESATQRPKTYTFMYQKRLYRFIDVPGIGDTRGTSQDRRNFEMILNELHLYENIHAFLILMASDSARMTVMFRFCLKELLTQLPGDAARNIDFCFTRARSTFYRPGGGQSQLQLKLNELRETRGVEIALNQDTVYYFDNDGFNYLCLRKHDFPVNYKEEEFSFSWKFSAGNARRLLDHVARIAPHHTRGILSLNEAKRIIHLLIPFSADITKNIQANKRIIKRTMDDFEQFSNQAIDAEPFMKLKQIVLEREPLDYPRTVCAGRRCIRNESIPGTDESQAYYPVCHDRCALKRVELGKYPDERLKRCRAMAGTPNCQNCGCPWEMHMHIRYKQKQVTVEVDNKEWIDNVLSRVENYLLYIDHLSACLEELKRKEKRIRSICAKFVAFLNANAIAVVNDAYGEYLKQSISISREEEGSAEKVAQLKQYLDHYLMELDLVEQCVKNGTENVTLEDIEKMKEELGNMKEFKAFMTDLTSADYELEDETHLDWSEDCA